jgi:hypothetical protein
LRCYLLLLLLATACAASVEWIRPERTMAENQADFATCREETYRRLRGEFAAERGLTGADIAGFPSENPIPNVPALGSIAGSFRSDPSIREDVEAGRQRAEWRRQLLMRDCLERAGFRPEGGGSATLAR